MRTLPAALFKPLVSNPLPAPRHLIANLPGCRERRLSKSAGAKAVRPAMTFLGKKPRPAGESATRPATPARVFRPTAAANAYLPCERRNFFTSCCAVTSPSWLEVAAPARPLKHAEPPIGCKVLTPLAIVGLEPTARTSPSSLMVRGGHAFAALEAPQTSNWM